MIVIVLTISTSDPNNDVPVRPVIKALGVRSMGGHHRVESCSARAEAFLFRLILKISGWKLGREYFPLGQKLSSQTANTGLEMSLDFKTGMFPFGIILKLCCIEIYKETEPFQE